MHVDVSRAYFHAKALTLVLVELPAEGCLGKDKGNIGLLKKCMLGTRHAESNWERDWQGHLENWGYELERSSRILFHNKKWKTSGLTHRYDFVVTGSKRSLLELKKRLESVYPNKANVIVAGSAKSIKALNRRICWRGTGILYQHDLRHVDVLVESMGLENGNTVQTPIIDTMNASVVGLRTNQQVQISLDQVLVLQSGKSRHNIRRERVVLKNVRSCTTQLF